MNKSKKDDERILSISAKVIALVDGGMRVDQAMDTVLGAGTYAKLASELYEAFRSDRMKKTTSLAEVG